MNRTQTYLLIAGLLLSTLLVLSPPRVNGVRTDRGFYRLDSSHRRPVSTPTRVDLNARHVVSVIDYPRLAFELTVLVTLTALGMALAGRCRMNRACRSILTLGMTLFLLMALYPPWRLGFRMGGGYYGGDPGYGWLWDPPLSMGLRKAAGIEFGFPEIDWQCLVLQCLVLAAFTIVGMVLAQSIKARPYGRQQ